MYMEYPRIVQIVPAEGWRGLFATKEGEQERTFTFPLSCWALVERLEDDEDFLEYEDEDEEEEESEEEESEEEEEEEEEEEDEDEEEEEVVYRTVEGVAVLPNGATGFCQDLPGFVCYLEPGEDPQKRYDAMKEAGLLDLTNLGILEELIDALSHA
ncbi:MAG: hypothetical protein M1319_01075, partial [Chloroflexi bacterium]|nr:hypothetical protein [Chloroflexota bacterium]